MTTTTPASASGRYAPPAAVVALVLISLLALASPPASAQQTPSATSSIRLSGVVFPHFRYGGDPDERSQSRFDVERAYLNVRATLGDNLGVAVTADIFQQGDSARAGFYGGWALRAKYAYVQYDALHGDEPPLGLRGFVRLGLLNTIIVGHVDDHWLRWISKSPVDRHGFMSSADAGAAVQLASTGGLAELYATVTNGEGYQRGEVDRFKDYSARLSLRPFASTAGWASGVVISPWGSLGSRGSRFVEGAGTVEPISRGLDRNMWGVFAGYRGTALTAGAEIAARIDESEVADTLIDVRPTFADRTRRIVSAFVVAKPFALVDSASSVPLGIVLRYDRLTSSTTPDGHGGLAIAGVTWDLSPRVSMALDYQGETRHEGFDGPDTRTYFLHAVARF